MIIILVGSNSVHTQRYLNAISPASEKVIFITNNIDNVSLPANTEAHCINFKLTNIKARFQIAKIIGQHPGSIVHIHQANSYAYHTLKAIKSAKLTCKTILTAWGSDVLVLPRQSLLLKKMVQFNLANSDVITSDSLYMSAQIKILCPTVRELHTINFGMQHFPDTLDLSFKENIILSNRLHKPLYNIDKIIEGYAKLVAQGYNDYKLVIAASGSETVKLEELAKSLTLGPDKIIFIGMVSYSELVKLYQKARIFISIPDSDATSLSVLEAMGHGCYPVLSNLPANLEWVIDGVNGIINQNPANLSDDLINAINLNTESYISATEFNYKLIQQKAVFNDNIQKFLSLYN